jgi:hypothetical protein
MYEPIDDNEPMTFVALMMTAFVGRIDAADI